MLRIGTMTYSNSLPITSGLELGVIPGDFQLVHAVPTKLNHLLLAGDLDVSLISAVSYLDHQDELTLLPDCCIAAWERCMSVKLFTSLSIPQLHGERVYLTSQSASSALLLKQLCNKFWHVDPCFELAESPSKHEVPQLLIGDDALRHSRIDPHDIDLAQAWYYATGRPFTFGVLAARKDLAPEDSKYCQTLIRASMSWAKENEERVLAFGAQKYAYSVELLREYLGCLHYSLGKDERDSLSLFQKHLHSPSEKALHD